MQQENLKDAAATPPPVVPTLEEKLEQAEHVLTTPKVESEKKDFSLPPLRTYQSDVADAIKENNTSVVQIALAEARRKERDLKSPELSTKKNVGFLFGGIVLVLLGLSVTGYFLFRSEPAPVAVVTEIPIIIPDAKSTIVFSNPSRTQILSTLKAEKNKTAGNVGKVDTIELVRTIGDSKVPIEAPVFLEAIGLSIPEELSRSFENKFVFGFHSLQERQAFLLLKTNSYQNTFAGMLAWEGDILYDLQGIFLNRELEATGNKESFKDEILANKDARVVRDTNGNIIFLYSFLDKETLLITTNTLTLKEIDARLRAAKLAR